MKSFERPLKSATISGKPNDSSLAHNEIEIMLVAAEAALCWISVKSEKLYLSLIHAAW